MKSRANLTLQLSFAILLFAANAFAQPNIYLRSTAGEPWNSNTNIESLNAAFGSGNWQDLRYETVNINALFNGADYIFMEGSDDNANALENFLSANLPAIESWVQSGGLLFINAAPNQGNGMSLGFGGVSLNYSNNTGTASATDPEHPIFNGPFVPVGTTWSGNSFGHATIEGAGLTPLIIEQGNPSKIVLAEKEWGAGLVLFGGMTMTNFHSPSPQATNLRSNILSLELINAGNDAGVSALESPLNFCPGTYPIEVTVENFGINIIDTVTVNWEYDGVLQPSILWTTSLDTADGVGSNTATVTLGSRNFVQGVPHDLRVWTSEPNGVTDTVATNDTLAITLQPSLDGTFTIGGASPDYATFGDAISALESFGLCGPVTFNVRSGTYNEQLVIPQFQGSSAINTVTFQSESLDSTSTVLSYSSNQFDQNFTLRFDGSSYVKFNQISLVSAGTSFGRVIEFRGGATYNEISNSIVQGQSVTTTSDYMALIFSDYGSNASDNNHQNRILNNQITGGSYGVLYYGYSNNPDQREIGMRVEGNNFLNQYYRGLQLLRQSAPQVIGNTITTTSTRYNFYGLYAEYCYDSLRFNENQIYLDNNGYGIYQYSNEGSPGNEGEIANNFIRVGGTDDDAVGIYNYNSQYQNYFHNNILITSDDFYSSYALNVQYCYDINIFNNILVNTGGGLAAYYSDDPNDVDNSIDYNDYFSTGDKVINYDGPQYDLTEWQQLVNQDSNSFIANPVFVSENDLHVGKAILDGAGLPVGITTDIDGESRSMTTPDVGADEFVASGSDAALVYMDYPMPPFASGNFDIKVVLQNTGATTLTSATINLLIDTALQTPYNWTGSLAKGAIDTVNLGTFPFNALTSYDLAAWSQNPNAVTDLDPTDDTVRVENVAAGLPGGTYTIGGTTPDFPDFSSAATVVSFGGILGPITFNVRAGTYNENITIGEIFGASASNTVTFQSEGGDSTAVILTNNAIDFNNNFTIKLDGADYINFKGITIEATNPSYGRVIQLLNGATNNSFENSILRGVTSSGSTSTNYAIIYSTGNDDNDSYNEFLGNLIQGGSYGAYYYGVNSNNTEQGTVFDGNIFENQTYQALNLYFQSAPLITNNEISTNTTRTDFFGIRAEYCQLERKILTNKIDIPNGGYGIYVNYNAGTSGSQGIIANNFISIGGSSTAFGIQNRYSDYQQIYHNNVHVYSTNTSGYAYFSTGGTEHDIRNNIFSNSGGGYAIYIQTSSAVTQLDYNDLYTTGSNLGYWSGNQSDLASWQAASNFDQHSISINPLFTTQTDLHVNKGLLNNTGTPIASVSTDIDGETRSLVSPDIGADEFEPTGLDVALIYLEPAEVKFGVGTNPVRIVIKNSGGTSIDSLVVNWEVNEVPQPNYIWTGTLATGETDTLNLGNYDFSFGTAYEISVSLSSPNGSIDIDPSDNTITASDLFAALGGSYTIGGTTPDFVTFTEAAQALAVGGVYTNTTFNVRAGTYTEQITFPELEGTSAFNQILFQSESGDSSDVILTYGAFNSGLNYTIQLNGVDYITFRDMTIRATGTSYGHVIDIRNGSSNNQFLHNRLEGITTTSTTTNLAIVYSEGGFNTSMNDNENRFHNNVIQNGSYGLYYLGYSTGEGNREIGTVITDNIITNPYYIAINIQSQEALNISGNIIESNSNRYNYRAINFQYCYVGSQVIRNEINNLNGGYGIYAYECDGSAVSPTLIANNFVHIGGTGNEAYGLRVEYSDYADLYHNTINLTNTITSSRALYNYSGSEVNILNNIFVNTGGGYGIYVGIPDAINSLDYNDYYVTGINFGYWNNNIPDFTNWKSTSGQDANSLNVDPRFISDTDLHVREIFLNEAATPLAIITNDIDGEIREAKPDIGADEFVPQSTDAGIMALQSPEVPFNVGTNEVIVQLKNSGLDTLNSVTINWELNGVLQDTAYWSGALESGDTVNVSLGSRDFNAGQAYAIKAWTLDPNGGSDGDLTNDTIQVNDLFAALSGVYTIGGNSPDFATFNEAVTALIQGGVVDSAIFNVRPGTYNEQFSIPELVGAYNPNAVVFQSENGDSSSVVISVSASSTNNYTVELAGADGITFRNMTITTLNNSYGRVISIRNESDNNRFEGNVLLGRNLNTSSTNMVVVASFDSKDDNNVFINNLIQFGSYAFYYYGQNTSQRETGTIIQGNVLENQYYRSIWSFYQTAPKIIGNTIRTSSAISDFYGMYLRYFENETEILQNDISIANSGYGIYYRDGYGTDSQRGLIANNFINIRGGTSNSYGFFPVNGSYQNFYHNTVNIATENLNTYGIYLSNVSNYGIRNNISTNTGGGFAIYNNNSTFTADYNNYFTTGENYAYNNGVTPSLNAWQSSTGGDQNSYAIDPRYISETDLHAREIILNDAGIGLPLVSVDIDGELRNPTTPDIGADEFTPGLADAGIDALINPNVPFAQGTQTVSVALKNHGLDTLTAVAIHWTVNDTLQPVVNWTGALPSGDTVHVDLGDYVFNPTVAYEVKSWTDGPNSAVDADNTNDTTEVTDLYAALIGTYTIGGTSPDFATFNDAVSALDNGGVIGAVQFNVRANSYNEQVSIPSIIGTSASDSVVFQSESGLADVSLIFGANQTDNYTLQLDGASFFVFRNISFGAGNTSYGTTVRLQNESHDNTFVSCSFNGITTTSTGSNLALIHSANSSNNNDNKFIDNRFIRGSIGYYGYGVNTGNLEQRTVLENNSFEDQYYAGIWTYYLNAPTFRLNTITTNTNYTTFYGIRTAYNDNAIQITRNDIQILRGGYGLYLERNDASFATKGLVANNFISIAGTTTARGIFTSYCTYQNIYHNSINITSTLINANATASYFNRGGNLDVKNNIFMNAGGSYAIYYNSVSSFTSDYNNLYTTGENLGYWSGNRTDLAAWRSYTGRDINSVSVDPFFYSDTDLHVFNVTLNASALKINEITEDFDGNPRTATPDIGADEFIPPTEDASVLSLFEPSNPVDEGLNDVVVELFNNASANLNSATINWTVNGVSQPAFDWTGSIAPSSSDSVTVGSFIFESGTAYEITAWSSEPNGLPDLVPSNDSTTVSNIFVGMSGTFTIGGIDPDFPNFTQAVEALHIRNVAGPVTFLIADGIYSERITINEVMGSSATNTVTFESASGDSTKVTLTSAPTSSENYTMRMLGTDYTTFRNMTFAATGGLYGRVVEMRDDANSNTFESCVFQSTIYNSTYQPFRRAGIYSDQSKDDYNVFKNNVFRDGAYGIYFYGGGTSFGDLENGTIIENNIFEDQYYATIWLYYQLAPQVVNNDIVTFSTNANFYGIYGRYLDRDLEISFNRISSNSGGYGISLVNSDGTSGLRGQVYNNFVHLGGSSTAYGLYLSSSNYQDFNFNNVNITSTNTSSSGTALYNASGSNIRIRNNALVNVGGGYAYYTNSGSAIPTSDHNDIYTTGANLAYWQNNYSSLEALQAASGKDQNSISIDPAYVDVSDLHVSQSNLDGAGTPITGITTDIDSQLRNEVSPDIGADEFGSGLTTNDIGVVALLGPNNDCFLDTAEQVSIRIQNFGIDTISDFSISYILNDTISVTEDIVGAELSGGKNLEYTFSTATDLSAAGFYNFIFYTSLAGDSNVNNDTLYNSVIRHYPAVTAEVSPNDTICQGSYAFLSADGGSTYKWRVLGSTYVFKTFRSFSINPSTTTTYTVEVANEFGCSDMDTVTIFVLPAPERPSIEVIGSTSACTQDTVRLVSSVKENIVWNTGAATSEIQVFDPGTYSVTHRDTITGCTSTRSITLSYSPPPYISVSKNPICQGESTTLTVQNGSSYLWSTGETTRSITVSPSADTTYVVDVVNADGCEYLGRAVTVRVNPLQPAPQITSISTDTEVCLGSSVTLSVDGNAQRYEWSNGRVGKSITVSPTSDTQYTVTATNGDCSVGEDQASVFVSVLPQPDAPIIVATGSSTLSFCDADSIILTSSDFADSLLWNTGDTTQSIVVFDPGVYTVSLTNASGCTNSASVTITDPPVPYIVGKSTVCEGESTTLSVNNGAFYSWSTGEDTRSITVTPDTTTMYYVDITNEEGCTYQDSIRVTILPLPEITGISGDTAICAGEEITLRVSGTADSFIWSEGGSGTSIKVSPSETTTFSVTATNGCTDLNFNDFSEVTVTVLPLPDKPTITPSGTTVICEGDAVELTSSIAGTIVWSTGDSTQSITVSEAGLYTVTNSNEFGCTQSDIVEILNPDEPELIVDGFTTICRGDSVELTYTNASTFTWSTGETTASIFVSPVDTATYYVSASNDLGCNYADSITINVIAPIPPDSVSNMVPSSDELDLSLPLALSWAPAANASNYDIFIWLDSLPKPGSPFVTNIDQISYLLKSGLNYGAVYNWQVIAKNSCHETPGPIQQFTLRELPDLLVDKVETPKSAFSGQLIDVTWEISNGGLGDTDLKKTWVDAAYLSVDQTLEYSVDTYLGGAVNLTALTAGQGYRNTASFRLPKGITGERYVIIVTDRYNKITEVDNNNNSNRNQTSMLVNLTPPPDLQVDQVQVPNNIFSGQNINVSWTIRNKGTGATDRSFWKDRVYITQDSILRTSSATQIGEFDHSGHLDPNDTYSQNKSVQVPEGIFGSYFVFVVTDVRNQLFEHVFENNNTGRSNGMEVILAPPPDLVVTNIDIPDSASNKETILVSWDVQNQGGSPVSGQSWQDALYISDSSVFVPNDAIFLGERGVSAELNLGDSYTSTRTIKIPDEINGTFHIWVVTDIANDIFEFENDDNNVTQSDPIEILSPDLIVSVITLPDSAASGKPFDVSWTVENAGPGTLFNSKWEDIITVDNSAIYNQDSVEEVGTLTYNGVLLPGETLEKNKSVTMPNGLDGTQFVHIGTDHLSEIFEEDNETNNFSYESMLVNLSPWPDLVPTVVTFVNDTATAGESVPITYSVANDGFVTATGSWVDRIIISTEPTFDPERDTLILEQVDRMDSLVVGSSYEVTTAFSLDPELVEGEYYFYLFTDAEDKLYEHTDEANNIEQIGPVFVNEYPPIDFKVDTLIAPDSAFSGTPVTIQWEVQNVGEAASLAGFWFDAIFISDDSLFDQTGDLLLRDWPEYGPLAKDEKYADQQEVILPDGIYGDKYLLLVTDYGDEEEEKFLIRDDDRSNNFFASPINITLTPPSDLVVEQFDVPTEGISGQPVSVTWRVRNQGVGPTTFGSWTDKIFLSTDFEIDEKEDQLLKAYNRIGDLDSLGFYTVTTDVFIPINAEGNYILIIKTDNNDVQYEHRAEGNNTATSIITVTKPLPTDLVVTQVIAPDTVIAGETMTVNWTIQNTGVNPATGVMSDIVYFSTDQTWDIDDVVFGELQTNINLPPLSEDNRSLTAPVNGVSLADYYLIVRTDVRNNIFESRDDNNETSTDALTNVVVRELRILEPLTATLENQVNRYYRIEVPDSLENETLLVTLDGDSLDAANEIYVKYGEVPTRVDYDRAFSEPFNGDQEIVIPDLQLGTYYLLVYGESTVRDSQDITLLASILNFEIRNVETNVGGNTGPVTVLVEGSKFTPDMTMILENTDTSFQAVAMDYIDPTMAFVTFDLTGVPLSRYDVVAEKPDGSFAIMFNGFEVQTSTGPVIETNLNYPRSTRPGRIVAITIQFANAGNVDVAAPGRTIISLFGAPLSYTVEDLIYNFEDLNMEFTEPRGPEGILRPGAISELTVYTKAIRRLRFRLLK